jgi:hypothetical protein
MFYVFSYTPSASDTEADPYILDLELTAGVVHQVDVLFQSGCGHAEFVQIFHGNHQLWPSNRGEKLRGDATIVSFRDFYLLNPGGVRLQAKIWTTLSADFKEVIIQMGVLPREVLQPLSFKELLKAASEL